MSDFTDKLDAYATKHAEGLLRGDMRPAHEARSAVVLLHEHVWNLYKMSDAQAQSLRARAEAAEKELARVKAVEKYEEGKK